MGVRDATITEFIESRFPEQINFGFSGGPVFFTQVQTTAGGFEQRAVRWEEARHRFSASHELKSQAELDELRAFFYATRGQAVAFRYFDWNDYASDMPNQIGTVPLFTLAASGTMTPQALVNTVTGALGLGDGTTTDFQLVKLYTPEAMVGDFRGTVALTFTNSTGVISRPSGSWVTDGFAVGQYVYVTGSTDNDGTVGKVSAVSALDLTVGGTLTDETSTANVRVFSQAEDVAPYLRDVKKPISGAVRPFVDGVAHTEATSGPNTFQLDATTGLVTFNTAPGAHAFVDGDYLFDVPCRFASDEMAAGLAHFNIGDWMNIELIEDRLS